MRYDSASMAVLALKDWSHEYDRNGKIIRRTEEAPAWARYFTSVSDYIDENFVLWKLDEPVLSDQPLPRGEQYVRILETHSFFAPTLISIASTPDGYDLAYKFGRSANSNGRMRYGMRKRSVSIARAERLTGLLERVRDCPLYPLTHVVSEDGTTLAEVVVADGSTWILEVRDGAHYCTASEHVFFYESWTELAAEVYRFLGYSEFRVQYALEGLPIHISPYVFGDP